MTCMIMCPILKAIRSAHKTIIVRTVPMASVGKPAKTIYLYLIRRSKVFAVTSTLPDYKQFRLISAKLC